MSIKPLLIAAAFALSSPLALANTITSDSCAPGVRDFSVTADTVLACLAAGTGNINGNNQADAGFLASGWTFIDDSDGAGGAHNGWLSGSLGSGLTGTFSINSAAYSTYDRIAIGFKSGQGQVDPDWAIFELADNTLTGKWEISGQQALSHAILYGRGTPANVPEPATTALFAIGLLSAFGFSRRRNGRK